MAVKKSEGIQKLMPIVKYLPLVKTYPHLSDKGASQEFIHWNQMDLLNKDVISVKYKGGRDGEECIGCL